MNAPAARSSRTPRTSAVRWSTGTLIGIALVAAMLLAGCRATGTTRGTGPAVTSPSADGLSPAGTPVAPAASVDPAVGVSTQPVYPVEPPAQGSFEGFATYSYIPAHPTGIIYLFHGSGGSADFAVKIESTDVLNDMIGRGFGYVATESTERSGERRWNVDDPSMTSNPDLARMDRLRRHVLDTTAVDAGTPTYGLGMSNGSAFAALWAAAESSAGVPISGVALYMAGPTKAVDRLGGLRVPTFMVVGVNDTVTDPAKEKADLAAIAHAGIPTELHEVIQRAVIPARYLRVPGVTEATAAAVVAAYRQAGLIDSAGTLVVTLPQSLRGDGADRLTNGVVLPTVLTPGQRIAVHAETLATIGAHEFNAEFKVQNADFFADHRTT